MISTRRATVGRGAKKQEHEHTIQSNPILCVYCVCVCVYVLCVCVCVLCVCVCCVCVCVCVCIVCLCIVCVCIVCVCVLCVCVYVLSVCVCIVCGFNYYCVFVRGFMLLLFLGSYPGNGSMTNGPLVQRLVPHRNRRCQ